VEYCQSPAGASALCIQPKISISKRTPELLEKPILYQKICEGLDEQAQARGKRMKSIREMTQLNSLHRAIAIERRGSMLFYPASIRLDL
jgi:hypothetical protein